MLPVVDRARLNAPFPTRVRAGVGGRRRPSSRRPATGRGLASLLYGVGPYDPVTFAAAVAPVVLAALAATAIPARRAARLDPMIVLRAE